MIVRRGRLTVADTRRHAITAECVACGETAVILAAREHAHIDHRCGRGVAGPMWTIVERPPGQAA